MQRIGLSLSGGGFRATVFHLGVLSRLADGQLLERVTALSTVSGGSLCAGLVFALSGYRWPASDAFKRDVLPQARERLTTRSIDRKLIGHVLTHPWMLVQARAELLARQLESEWGIDGSLQRLPESPDWMANATCFETGKNWRFSRKRMGDHKLGYSALPTLPIADAMAASSGFPGLVGPLEIDTRRYQWFEYADAPQAPADESPSADPDWGDADSAAGTRDLAAAARAGAARTTRPVTPTLETVHLWDGGIYDNLGIEALFKPGRGLRSDIDFLVVSDASGRPGEEKYPAIWRPDEGLNRLINIAKGQIEGLRSRTVVSHFQHADAAGGAPGSAGRYFRIGRTPADILRSAAERPAVTAAGLSAQSLSAPRVDAWSRDAQQAVGMETAISRLSGDAFDALHRHGYAVADYVLFAYGAPGAFEILGER